MQRLDFIHRLGGNLHKVRHFSIDNFRVYSSQRTLFVLDQLQELRLPLPHNPLQDLEELSLPFVQVLHIDSGHENGLELVNFVESASLFVADQVLE